MQYKANVNYKIVYLTKTGEEKEIDFTPEKDMNIAELIITIKANNKDFFKLKSANEIKGDENMKENKEIVTESEDMLTNLYDVLEARNFEDVDITDKSIDMMVAFCLDAESGDSDSYDAFLTLLAKELKVDPISTEQAKKADIITVDMSKWVSDNFDKLDSIFDISGSSRDESIANMVEMMEAVISGAAKDSTYSALLENKVITERSNKMNKLSEATNVEHFKKIDYDPDTFEALVQIENKATLEDMKKIASKEFLEEIVDEDEFWNYLLQESNESIRKIADKYFPQTVVTESEDEEEFEELQDFEELSDGNNIQVSNELEGTGEDQTETAEEVSNVIDDVKDEVNDTDVLAVDTSNSSLDVLVADEESAIDGYNSFLNQAKNTLIPALYEVLESEINEIIRDEEDHINKLNTIKANFKFDNLAPVEESKKLNETHSDNGNIYEKIIAYYRNKGLSDDEIAVQILNDILPISLLDFALEQLDDEQAEEYYNEISEMYESKSLKEDINNLKVGDMVTIPYARGPRYTEDKSEWVKGKILSIDSYSVDLEVPTTLTVSASQLNKWLSKEESKLTEQIITSSGQEFGDMYDDLYNKKLELDREFGSDYGTIGRSNPNNKYKDKLDKIDKLLDIIAAENKGKSDLDDVRVLFDLGTIDQQEELRNLVTESKVVKEDHQLYYSDIQNMSTEERHKLWMTEHDKDFEDTDEGNDMFWDWAEEEFPIK